jgi:hypothetical protein
MIPQLTDRPADGISVYDRPAQFLFLQLRSMAAAIFAPAALILARLDQAEARVAA